VHDVSVLDLSTDHAGAFGAHLLAMLGATVTLVEPPGGHPLLAAAPLLADGRSTTWAYLTSRKTIHPTPLDPSDAVALAGDHDIVLLSANGPIAATASLAATLRRTHQRLVVVVTSPDGIDASAGGLVTTPLQDWALSGHLALNGEFDRQPIPGGGPWLSNVHGGTAAFGALAALRRARATGSGDLVDVSTLSVGTWAHQWSIVIATHQGICKRRWGNRHGESHHPLALFPCADAWVCIGAVSGHQWEGLCLAIDHPELLADESLYIPATRFDRADELDELIIGWTMQHPVDEVVATLQANNCPAGRVNDLTEVLEDPQLTARDAFEPLPSFGPDARIPAPPVRFATGPVPAEPAPAEAARLRRPGAAGNLPLRGVRILEFTIAWAGPLACKTMGDLGADVIKIEHPTSRGLAMSGTGADGWDPASWERGTLPPPATRNGVYPDADPGVRWWNRMGWFNKVNRSKRSLCADLKAPGGRELFEELVRSADVVVNNYSPRGVRSLGIDHESLRAINPRIVTIDLSGFGATGPGADQVSWGPILDAASGFAATTGYADSGPYKQGLAFPDAVGGVFGAATILAALHERDRTGAPVHVDVSQLETLLTLGGELVLEASVTGRAPARRGARAHPSSEMVQGVYPAAGDDRWIALTVRHDADWAALCTVVGAALDRPAWAGAAARLADHDAIDAAIAAWTAGGDADQRCDALQAVGVPAVPVLRNVDLVAHPRNAQRGMIVTLDVDGTPQRFPGFPIRFDEAATEIRPCPDLGHHNAEILAELGHGADRLAELIASGALADGPPA